MTARDLKSKLAIDGGAPVRESMLPYGRQYVDERDILAVRDVLLSDWLTTGPKVSEFEQFLAERVGAAEAVAVSNGTAALHAAMFAVGIGPGDEVIVPAMTFAASANCVLYQGGKPVFVDSDPETLLVDPDLVKAKVTPRTRAIIAVDYAGQPCDYDRLRSVSDRHGIALVADACHALGGSYKGRPVGSLGDLNVFSFHPVKHVAAGEGGAITTDNASMAKKMRGFRNHGISADHHQRAKQGGFFYEMEQLGYNYRLTDIQCALALSQLGRLSESIQRRRTIADRYDAAFAQMPPIQPMTVRDYASHAYHLYAIQIELERLTASRAQVFAALRAENIGVNVHYLPVYLHPYYRKLGYEPGLCPVAEAAYQRLISLPMFYGMTDGDVQDVIEATAKVVDRYRR